MMRLTIGNRFLASSRWVWGRIGILVWTFGICVAIAETSKSMSKPTWKQKGYMKESVFKMRDADYFAEPLVVSNEIAERLIDGGFIGLTIDGPSAVEFDRRTRFPIVAARVAESEEASRWIFEEYVLITAMDISSETLHAGYFVEQRFLDVDRDLENNPPPPGKSASVASADLFSRLYLEKKPAEYLVNVILLEKSSNRIRVKVGESGLLGNETAFRKEIAKRAMQKSKRIRVKDLQDAAGKESMLTSLVIPDESGVVGRVVFQQTADGKESVPWLHLAYRIPYSNNGQKDMREGGASGRALVPIEMLATGTKVSAPWIRHLEHLGSIQHVTGGERYLIGKMGMKLTDLGGLEDGQVYSFYAFAGELMSAPIKLDWKTTILRKD